MEKQHGHIGETRTYVIIWVMLLALTGITITVAGMHLGRFSTLTALVIASIKASLVLWFFMHLKYEKRLFKYHAPGPGRDAYGHHRAHIPRYLVQVNMVNGWQNLSGSVDNVFYFIVVISLALLLGVTGTMLYFVLPVQQEAESEARGHQG